MLEKLACNLGRSDEVPNVELAEALCQSEDKSGIREIVSGLRGKNKAVAADCIKVLYEIGARKPELVAAHADEFIALLSSKDNRLVWGGMTALAAIAEEAPAAIYKQIDKVLSAFRGGSVITVDNGVTVLAKLCKAKAVYRARLFPLLLEHLRTCRAKEVPQHAERISICVDSHAGGKSENGNGSGRNAENFVDVLEKRKPELTPAQATRANRLLKKYTL
ncbi:MAG: hypothetical protein FWF49_05745 [Oscillospiraceae bacterium]|nr:hypothetical protein [Oscillospiraceae bacterium]